MAESFRAEIGAGAKTRSPNYQEIYCNYSETRLSPWDISLIFSKLQSTLTGGPPEIEEQVAVIFSPQQFKVMAATLTAVLSAYETHFGEINVRPDVGKSFAAEDIERLMTKAHDAAVKKD